MVLKNPNNLLVKYGRSRAAISKGPLIQQQNWLDFDSAIPRFESWHFPALHLMAFLTARLNLAVEKRCGTSSAAMLYPVQ